MKKFQKKNFQKISEKNFFVKIKLQINFGDVNWPQTFDYFYFWMLD